MFVAFFVRFSPISVNIRLSTSSTILSSFCRSILLGHSYLFLLRVPNLSNGTPLDQWLDIFYFALWLALIYSLLFSHPMTRRWQLLLSPVYILGSYILFLPGQIFNGINSLFRSAIFWYSLGILVPCVLTLFTLPFYRKYELPLFAAHNLVAFLLCYAYTYDPRGTASPDWESIWG